MNWGSSTTLAGRARVLALDPDGVPGPSFTSPVASVASIAPAWPVLAIELASVSTHRVVVPLHSDQQVLHPVRTGIVGVLGDTPTVLIGSGASCRARTLVPGAETLACGTVVRLQDSNRVSGE